LQDPTPWLVRVTTAPYTILVVDLHCCLAFLAVLSLTTVTSSTQPSWLGTCTGTVSLLSLVFLLVVMTDGLVQAGHHTKHVLYDGPDWPDRPIIRNTYSVMISNKKAQEGKAEVVVQVP
jgi:hypothetical protein